MDNEYRLIKTCEHAFDTVTEAVNGVVEAYRHSLGQAWALHSPHPDCDWLANALLDFWYEGDQDGRTTRVYIGLIAADPQLIQAAERANETKDAFFEAMTAIKDEYPQRLGHMKYELAHRTSRFSYVNEHLRRSGLARLNLKQTWRHLPILEQPASRIRLSWYSNGRSIKRMTTHEAERRLASYDTDAAHIQIQLRALASIPSDEPLALVQDQTPVMRANIFYGEPLPDGRLRRAMNLPLPLLVPSVDGRLPNHNQPLPEPKKTRVRAIRNDQKIEDDPFLPSIRVYRYRSESGHE